jgi:hypothetical protein
MTTWLSVASRRRHFTVPKLTTPIVPIRLPAYLYLALALLAVTAVVVMGWVVLVRQDVQLSNPFSNYAEIFPGQGRNALISLDFSCNAYPYYSLDSTWKDYEYCTGTLEKGTFWLISATLKNGRVQRTDFVVRKGALTLGDLMFLWGRPQVRLYRKSAHFEWPSLGISASGSVESRQFSYFIPVTRVSIVSTAPKPG